jgi:hypothetical protein
MDARTLEACGIRLAELRSEERQRFAVSAAALGVSLALTAAYQPLVLPLFVGGIVLWALAMRSMWRHWDLVDRLANDRDAHVIPEVATYASRHHRPHDESDVDGERRSD